MDEKLILYIGEKNISSWSMRAWIALAAKGIPFEERTILLAEDRDRSRRRAVSPTGRVPVLHAGNFVVPDSLAILEFLEESYAPPAWPALWPADRGRRAHARWLAAAMHSGFPELRRSMSFNLCFLPRPPEATREAQAEAQEMLGYWQKALEVKEEPGPFLFGAFGGADIMFAPAIVRLTAFGVSTKDAPRTAEYMGAVLDHPPVRKWMDAARALPPRESY